MNKIRLLIENNFAFLLIIGAVLGFVVPGVGEQASQYIIMIFIGSLILFACPSVKVDEFLKVDIFQIGLFTFVRFAIFPIVLFYLANILVPEYAVGVLLLALMPVAIGVTSLVTLVSGRLALGLSLIVVSSLLAPAFVPSIFSFLGHIVEVNAIGMFITLLSVVLVPSLIYFLIIDKINPIKSWVDRNYKSGPIFILALVLFIVVSTNKEAFLSDIPKLFEVLGVMMVLFFCFYGFGVLYSYFVPKEQKSTYILSSGATNNGLAIGLSFLYFNAETTFFVVSSEIVWCFYVAAAQRYLSR